MDKNKERFRIIHKAVIRMSFDRYLKLKGKKWKLYYLWRRAHDY